MCKALKALHLNFKSQFDMYPFLYMRDTLLAIGGHCSRLESLIIIDSLPVLIDENDQPHKGLGLILEE